MTETPILDDSAVSEIEARAGDKWTVNTDTIRALCATVKHLRAENDEYERRWRNQTQRNHTLSQNNRELQSQLEQLRAERDELRNALLPFALLDIRHLQDRSDHEPIWAINKSQITNGHVRVAQRLIQQAVAKKS